MQRGLFVGDARVGALRPLRLGITCSLHPPLRKQDFWAGRSFLTDFQILGRFLKRFAGQKVTFWVRDFGVVFDFPHQRHA